MDRPQAPSGHWTEEAGTRQGPVGRDPQVYSTMPASPWENAEDLCPGTCSKGYAAGRCHQLGPVSPYPKPCAQRFMLPGEAEARGQAGMTGLRGWARRRNNTQSPAPQGASLLHEGSRQALSRRRGQQAPWATSLTHHPSSHPPCPRSLDGALVPLPGLALPQDLGLDVLEVTVDAGPPGKG